MDSSSKSNSSKENQSSGLSLDPLVPLFPSMPTSAQVSPTSATASNQEPITVEECQYEMAQYKLAREKFKAASAQMEFVQAMARVRPSHLYPVKIYHNQVTWVCEYTGDENAVGCGDSPNEAMIAFDNTWLGLNGLDG